MVMVFTSLVSIVEIELISPQGHHPEMHFLVPVNNRCLPWDFAETCRDTIDLTDRAEAPRRGVDEAGFLDAAVVLFAVALLAGLEVDVVACGDAQRIKALAMPILLGRTKFFGTFDVDTCLLRQRSSSRNQHALDRKS